MTQIRPLYDRVLIERIESDEKTAGGIIIPDTAKEKTQVGNVIAVGQGKMKIDGSLTTLTVKAGDKVLIGKFSGTEASVGGKEYLIVREEEILGVVD